MDWRYNTIWLDQIEEKNKLTWDYSNRNPNALPLSNQEYLTLWQFKRKGNKSFDALPSSDKLLFLNLNSSNIVDFQGVDCFPALKRLELHHCLKLATDEGINDLNNSLEILHINQSKKLSSVHEISKLSSLKVLSLNNCGPLPNISFIKKLPHLVDFRFVNTNIQDGDLSHILEHPRLRSVTFFNKRNYNFKHEEIDELLKAKNGQDNKDYVYKHEYRTFKYKDL